MLTYLWNAAMAAAGYLGPLLIIAALLGFGFRSFFRKIPPKYHGRVNTFGKRGRAVSEGLCFLIPFVQDVELYSGELQRIPLEVVVTSKDQLEIVIQLSAEFVPDQDLVDAYENSMKELSNLLAERIKTVVGQVSGLEKADDFIKHRQAIGHLINCLLRLKDLPHEGVQIHEWLRFYELLAKDVDQLLKKESDNPQERSDVEIAYGIDILNANLPRVDFSAATKAALEKNKQMAAVQKAAGHLRQTALSAKKDLGLEGREAANFAQVTAGLAKKEVISIEGGGVSPLPLLNIGGGR